MQFLKQQKEGGVRVCVATHAVVFRGARGPLKTPAWEARVCGDAVLRYFRLGFAVIFILTRGIAVSKH